MATLNGQQIIALMTKGRPIVQVRSENDLPDPTNYAEGTIAVVISEG